MKKVQFIKYGEEKIPYRISYKSLMGWQKETGKGLSDLDEIDKDFSLLGSLFYHSVLVGYKSIGKDCPYKREAIDDILDECMLDFIGGIGSFFQEGVIEKK